MKELNNLKNGEAIGEFFHVGSGVCIVCCHVPYCFSILRVLILQFFFFFKGNLFLKR
jgi:hypothetical protein